jgi:hypothetical protein
MCFSKLLKDYARFARGPQILFAFIEIYLSLVEAILIYYWRVLSMIWKKSSTSFISPIGKMAMRTAPQRLILKVQKPVEVPI